MKRIKLLVGRAGAVVQRPGQELDVGSDVDADEAERLVASGAALDVSPPQVRKAVAPKAKTRAKKKG